MKKSLIGILGVLLMVTAVAKTEVAVFAGGCFWCLQSDFDKLKGVVKTVSGYDGGQTLNPTYDTVSSGKTHYVESVKVYYNPRVVSYAQLLDYFWHHIDPVDGGGQFCDRGAQYKSVIFYSTEAQKIAAEKSKAQLKKRFGHVATRIVPTTHFYAAEEYHQDYYKKNPIRYRYYRWNCSRDARVKEVWKNA